MSGFKMELININGNIRQFYPQIRHFVFEYVCVNSEPTLNQYIMSNGISNNYQ